MKTYLFHYRHAGANWSFEIQAESEEDARARVAKLAFAHYDGELVATVPSGLGWLVRTATWLANLRRHK